MESKFFDVLEDERIKDERKRREETDKVVAILKNANLMWAKEQPVVIVEQDTTEEKKVATDRDVNMSFLFGVLAGAIGMGILCVLMFCARLVGLM